MGGDIDLDSIAEMPLSELYARREEVLATVESWVRPLDPDTAVSVYGNVVSLWCRLLKEAADFATEGVPLEFRESLLTVCSLGAYAAVESIGEFTEPGDDRRTAIRTATLSSLDSIRPLLNGGPSSPGDLPSYAGLTYHLLAGYWLALDMEQRDASEPAAADMHYNASMVDLNIALAARQVSDIIGYGEIEGDNVWLRVLFGRWSTEALATIATAAQRSRDRTGRRHATQNASTRSTRYDLALLKQAAARSPRLVETVGSERRVDAVFERQLALVMSSFGFVAVPADRATRSIDLICIGHPANRGEFKFLLEAKSTKGRYSLPTDDERALVEYVHHVRERIDNPETLEFLLIVSSRPASTLEAKLDALQSRLKIPVRYANADALARLRRELPAQAPMAELRTCILDSPECVLSDDFWRPVTKRYLEVVEQRAQFTNTLLGQLDTKAPRSR